jgi:hypothetical protein
MIYSQLLVRSLYCSLIWSSTSEYEHSDMCSQRGTTMLCTSGLQTQREHTELLDRFESLGPRHLHRRGEPPRATGAGCKAEPNPEEGGVARSLRGRDARLKLRRR